MFRLFADPEAVVLRLVQSGCVLHIVDNLSPVHDLDRPLPGHQLPTALRTRHQQATDDHQDCSRLDRFFLYRRTTLRALETRQQPVAPPVQR